jgi:hypothetical protein
MNQIKKQSLRSELLSDDVLFLNIASSRNRNSSMCGKKSCPIALSVSLAIAVSGVSLSNANAQTARVACPPPAIITNNASIEARADNYGVLVTGGACEVTNLNSIYASNIPRVPGDLDAALGVSGTGTLTTLINNGTINALSSNYALSISSGGVINTLNNNLYIRGNQFESIYNAGTITTINNTGANAIINSPYIAIGNYSSGGGIGVIGAINNSGYIQIANPSQANTAAIWNENQITSITNSGSITGGSGAWAAIYNAGAGYVTTITNTGTIQASSKAIDFGGNATQTSTLTNTGTISGAITSGTMGGVTINQNGGTITGAVNLAANTSVINFNSGSIVGNVNFNGATNTMNIAGGSIIGNVTNTIANKLTINSIGSFTTQGDFGSFGASIAALNVNSGTFTNQNSIFATTTNVLSGAILNNSGTISGPVSNDGILNLNGFPTVRGDITGSGFVNVNGAFLQQGLIGSSGLTITDRSILYMNNLINSPTTVNNGGALVPIGNQTINDNLTNKGVVFALNSKSNLTVTGAYAQSSEAIYTSQIDGLGSGQYSRIISGGPLNIASGAIIIANLNPSLVLNPGTVIQNVIQGTGALTQQGVLSVFTVSDRYALLSQWDGSSVDLYLPGNSSNSSQAIKTLGGTYTGALAKQTLWSIFAVQDPTLNAMHQRYAILNAVMEYDCNRFEKHNFCISAQARATGFGKQATGAGVFNIAYRPTSQTRIGAYIDYQAGASLPTTYGVPVAGAVSTGSVDYGYDNATLGVYAGFSQSGYSNRLVNTGVQAFVSSGYNPGKIQTTRALILDPLKTVFVDSQPGSGVASLDSYFVRGLLGYGFGVTDNLTLMPYLGLRHTDVTRGGYMEGYNAFVTQPLVYSSYYERLVTGFGGAMLDGQLTDKFGLLAGLGAELDFSRSASGFGGYSPFELQNLTTFGRQHGGSWNGFRPTGNLGAYYDVIPNHRVSINGYVGQQAWSTRTYTTALLGYHIAF